MEDKKKRNKGHFMKKAVFLVMGLALGFLLGFSFIAAQDHFFGDEATFHFLGSLLILLLCYFIEVISHEAGHLIMGMLTGYEFSSFRVMSWMLVRTGGKMSVRKFSIPGTLGQCLLIPPERDGEGNYPYVLYNLGGIIVNLIVAIVGFVIIFCTDVTGWLGLSCAYAAGVGLMMAVENAVPLNSLGVTNDGRSTR